MTKLATKSNFVTTSLDYVATKLEDKLCHDKVFYVATKPKTNFVIKNILCCNKEISIVTKISLSQQSFSITIEIFLLQQRNLCHVKDFSVSVMSKISLSQQSFSIVTEIFMLQQRNLCCDKHFSVATKFSFCNRDFSIATKKSQSQQSFYVAMEIFLLQ